MELFHKFEVNITLINVNRQISKYANFFKELCVNKKKNNEYEKVLMGQNVLPILQKKLPKKKRKTRIVYYTMYHL